jgi:UDP-N-acetylmuramate dehydrogenase
MVLPRTKEELLRGYRVLVSLGCPVFIMGRGTDLLVRSGGMRGVVLKLGDNFSGVTVVDDCVTALAGTPLSVLVQEAAAHGLGGAPFLAGIPGTLGGALAMNAGAYGGEIGDFVEEVFLTSAAGDLVLLQNEMDFGYRHSILAAVPLVVTGVRLKLIPCREEESISKLKELNARRRDKQPLEYPSAGSTFRRPEGGYAGTLIEQTGLKGLRIGGAEVSEKHAGFVINRGGATPEELIALIEEVQARVFQASGIWLEPEVKIAGEK